MQFDLFNYFTEFITQFAIPPFVPIVPTYSVYDPLVTTNEYFVELINVNKDIVPTLQALQFDIQSLNIYYQNIIYLLWWLLVLALISFVFGFVKFIFYTLRDAFF